MTISSLTSSSAASQLSYAGKLSSANASSSGEGGQVGRRPPPPDGGGFIDAIASALQSLGISSTDSTASTASTNGTDNGNAAQALGSFLHELMGALHEQGASSPPPSGEGQAYGPPGGGGPGRLEADLQSLISKLGASGESSDTSETSETSETSGSALETSFQSLLEALGSDTSDASGKLASFLQALSGKLPDAGSSGNLINTSV